MFFFFEKKNKKMQQNSPVSCNFLGFSVDNWEEIKDNGYKL